MKKIAQTLAIVSPIIGVASFLTLGNAIVVESAALNSVGVAVALISLVAFVTSLIVLIIGSLSGKARNVREPSQANVSTPAPRWYQLTKLLVGLSIILGLYLVVPTYMLFSSSGPSFDVLELLLMLLTVLPMYAIPFPYGVVVWPLTAIGIGLILSHRRRWIVLDVLAVALTVLIIAGVNMVLSGGIQKSSQPVGSIGGTETVQITASDGEGGRTPSVGVCISARIQAPRDDAPDMICGITDRDGKAAFRVGPGKYYIYLDLRSRDEFSFDPKFPQQYVEWEVLPQSINEVEFLVTPRR